MEFEEDDCFLWEVLLGAGSFQKRMGAGYLVCLHTMLAQHQGTRDSPEWQAGHTNNKISTWALFRAKQTEDMKTNMINKHEKDKKFCLFKDWVQLRAYFPLCCRRASCGDAATSM